MIFTSPVYAVFNFTAQPAEGGFDLRFGRINPTDFKQVKEILISVNSDIGKQYRISQKLISPLKTSDGTELQDGQFKMYPLVNSNSRGTLLYREEMPVSDFESIFYSSNGTGENDSMRLVYTITPQENQIPGTYYGRLAYIMTPVDSTQNQVVVTLNVYIELAGGNAPLVEVITSTGSKRLFLTSKGMERGENLIFTQPVQIGFKIKNPVGTTYRIYQTLENRSLTSTENEDFDLSKILFSLTGGRKGTLISDGNLLGAANKMLLYESDPNGSPDEFVMTLKPFKDFRFQKTNQYRGKLNFIVESNKLSGQSSSIFETLDVEIEIVPLFDIYVYSQDKEGVVLDFGDISYKTGPKTSTIDLIIESNRNQPYQVVQRVASPLVDQNGVKIPEEDFTVRIENVLSNESPQSYLKDALAVKEGETVIFSSGPTGESVQFKAEYRLKMRPDTKGGSYSARIGYSLTMN